MDKRAFALAVLIMFVMSSLNVIVQGEGPDYGSTNYYQDSNPSEWDTNKIQMEKVPPEKIAQMTPDQIAAHADKMNPAQVQKLQGDQVSTFLSNAKNNPSLVANLKQEQLRTIPLDKWSEIKDSNAQAFKNIKTSQLDKVSMQSMGVHVSNLQPQELGPALKANYGFDSVTVANLNPNSDKFRFEPSEGGLKVTYVSQNGAAKTLVVAQGKIPSLGAEVKDGVVTFVNKKEGKVDGITLVTGDKTEQIALEKGANVRLEQDKLQLTKGATFTTTGPLGEKLELKVTRENVNIFKDPDTGNILTVTSTSQDGSYYITKTANGVTQNMIANGKFNWQVPQDRITLQDGARMDVISTDASKKVTAEFSASALKGDDQKTDVQLTSKSSKDIRSEMAGKKADVVYYNPQSKEVHNFGKGESTLAMPVPNGEKLEMRFSSTNSEQSSFMTLKGKDGAPEVIVSHSEGIKVTLDSLKEGAAYRVRYELVIDRDFSSDSPEAYPTAKFVKVNFPGEVKTFSEAVGQLNENNFRNFVQPAPKVMVYNPSPSNEKTQNILNGQGFSGDFFSKNMRNSVLVAAMGDDGIYTAIASDPINPLTRVEVGLGIRSGQPVNYNLFDKIKYSEDLYPQLEKIIAKQDSEAISFIESSEDAANEIDAPVSAVPSPAPGTAQVKQEGYGPYSLQELRQMVDDSSNPVPIQREIIKRLEQEKQSIEENYFDYEKLPPAAQQRMDAIDAEIRAMGAKILVESGPILKLVDTGDYVRQLQGAHNLLVSQEKIKGPKIKEDGIYGPDTKTAVSKMQEFINTKITDPADETLVTHGRYDGKTKEMFKRYLSGSSEQAPQADIRPSPDSLAVVPESTAVQTATTAYSDTDLAVQNLELQLSDLYNSRDGLTSERVDSIVATKKELLQKLDAIREGMIAELDDGVADTEAIRQIDSRIKELQDTLPYDGSLPSVYGTTEVPGLPGDGKVYISGNQLYSDCGTLCRDRPMRVNPFTGQIEAWTYNGLLSAGEYVSVDDSKLRLIPNTNAKLRLFAEQTRVMSSLGINVPVDDLSRPYTLGELGAMLDEADDEAQQTKIQDRLVVELEKSKQTLFPFNNFGYSQEKVAQIDAEINSIRADIGIKELQKERAQLENKFVSGNPEGISDEDYASELEYIDHRIAFIRSLVYTQAAVLEPAVAPKSSAPAEIAPALGMSWPILDYDSDEIPKVETAGNGLRIGDAEKLKGFLMATNSFVPNHELIAAGWTDEDIKSARAAVMKDKTEKFQGLKALGGGFENTAKFDYTEGYSMIINPSQPFTLSPAQNKQNLEQIQKNLYTEIFGTQQLEVTRDGKAAIYTYDSASKTYLSGAQPLELKPGDRISPMATSKSLSAIGGTGAGSTGDNTAKAVPASGDGYMDNVVTKDTFNGAQNPNAVTVANAVQLYQLIDPVSLRPYTVNGRTEFTEAEANELLPKLLRQYGSVAGRPVTRKEPANFGGLSEGRHDPFNQISSDFDRLKQQMDQQFQQGVENLGEGTPPKLSIQDGAGSPLPLSSEKSEVYKQYLSPNDARRIVIIEDRSGVTTATSSDGTFKASGALRYRVEEESYINGVLREGQNPVYIELDCSKFQTASQCSVYARQSAKSIWEGRNKR